MAKQPIPPSTCPPGDETENSSLGLFDLNDLSPTDQERHLAIWREANLIHAQSHGAVAGQLTSWIFAILSTSSLGGLALAVTESDKLAYPTAVKAALFLAFMSTILGGIAAMDNYNSVANRSRIMALVTRETFTELNQNATNLSNRQIVSDKWASRLLIFAVLAICIAGVIAL